MEYEDKIRLLSENAMLADDGMFSPEMLAGWQNRMRIAAGHKADDHEQEQTNNTMSMGC